MGNPHAWQTDGFTLDDLYTTDPVMQVCLDRAKLAAATDLPILILGESGTGKTLLARAVHNSSRRARGPFVSFNAAALSETLLDSQLFGHEAGAFTGARRRVKGKFELADTGTLFIDEVADLSASGQSKILRAVERGEFERLGAETLLHADVRLVSATHHPLRHFTSTGQFRADLFFRLSGVTLAVPPLRERRNDLPALVAAEIERACRLLGRSVAGLEREAADQLLSYAWPGNLRELQKVVHAAVALSPGDVIRADSLLLGPAAVAPPTTDAEEAGTGGAGSSRLLRAAIHRHVRQVLEETGGNKRRAARELGVSRATLARKLREMAAGRSHGGRPGASLPIGRVASKRDRRAP